MLDEDQRRGSGADVPGSGLPTVAGLGEHALIERIRQRIAPADRSVVVGIGDDAAVVEPDRGTLTAVTCDALVEGVHFDFRQWPPDAVGHKALAVNLSDLAAMGAVPRYAVLSLALPPSLPVPSLEALLDGLTRLATRYATTIVGGNVTRSTGPLFVDITAWGSVKRRRVLTRRGLRVGDDLYVSGEIGGAAAGLAALGSSPTPGADLERCRQRLWWPDPRVRLGTQLAKNRAARACIDLSDGLADGVRQLATASGVGVLLEADAIPIAPDARRWFDRQAVDGLSASLTGGDDYELLFSAPPGGRRRLAAVSRLAGQLRLTRIGSVTKEATCRLLRNGREEPLPEGYQHFR